MKWDSRMGEELRGVMKKKKKKKRENAIVEGGVCERG